MRGAPRPAPSTPEPWRAQSEDRPQLTEDRLLQQKEAARILGMSVASLRRRASIPRVAVPTAGRKRKVTYKYRLSTLVRLMDEWEEKSGP